MNKFFIVYRVIKEGHFEDIQDAIKDAKRRQAADKDNQYAVMESKCISVLPVPNIEMQEFV